MDLPASDLSRATVHERNNDWPDVVRVVAQWGKRSKSFIITADEYFGRGVHGAPMNGERLMQQIETLRRQKP